MSPLTNYNVGVKKCKSAALRRFFYEGAHMAGNKYLSIDTTDANRLIRGMRRAMTEKQFNKLIYRTISETGRRTRTIVKRALPPDYHAKPNWILHNMGRPRISGGENPSCIIPIDGARGYIAKQGGQFRAKGGRRLKRLKGASAPVYAKIVKSGTSALPTGKGKGDPHFTDGGGNVWVRVRGSYYKPKGRRTRKERIRRAVGIGVPQMPMTRAREEVNKLILEHMKERLIHNFNYILSEAKK